MTFNTFTNGTTADADEVNENFQQLIKDIGIGQAELSYRTLQSNNIFQNGSYFVVDEFVDSTGTNNTIGGTSARYDSTNDCFVLGTDLPTYDEASGDTLHITGNTLSGISNVFDNDDNTSASDNASGNPIDKTYYVGRTFSEKFVAKCRVVAKIYTHSGSSPIREMDIETYDGSTWTEVHGSSLSDNVKTTSEFVIEDNIQGIRVKLRAYSGGASGQITVNLYSFEYGDYNSNSTVSINQNTVTLDGSETYLIVYGDVDVTATGTSINVDVGDGSSTISSQTLNEIIDISSLSSGTLTLTFNLATSNTANTPKFYGYGVRIFK